MQPAAVQVEKISRGNFACEVARGVFSSHPYRGKEIFIRFYFIARHRKSSFSRNERGSRAFIEKVPMKRLPSCHGL